MTNGILPKKETTVRRISDTTDQRCKQVLTSDTTDQSRRSEEVRHYGHAFLNYESNVQHTLLTDYVDMSTNPTFVILDSGCTRAMGSRFAIDRLVKACMNHRYSHLIKFTKEASNNRFSFANGESSHVKEKLIIHLKNPKHPTGWVTTTVDILDKGRCTNSFLC